MLDDWSFGPRPTEADLIRMFEDTTPEQLENDREDAAQARDWYGVELIWAEMCRRDGVEW